MAAVSWWLAHISRKREDGEERSGYKKEGVMRGGEAPQASNSDREENSPSFFCPSNLFSAPRPHHFIPLCLGLSCPLGVCGLFTVCSGWGGVLPFISRPYLLLSSHTPFLLSPSRVALVTSRLTVRLLVGCFLPVLVLSLALCWQRAAQYGSLTAKSTCSEELLVLRQYVLHISTFIRPTGGAECHSYLRQTVRRTL